MRIVLLPLLALFWAPMDAGSIRTARFLGRLFQGVALSLVGGVAGIAGCSDDPGTGDGGGAGAAVGNGTCRIGFATLPGCTPSEPTEPAPGEDVRESAAGDCRQVLDSDVSTPTRLADLGEGCDYYLSGWVEVTSNLALDPGVTIRAEADARLVVDGGEIHAVGTAEAPIVMEGLSNTQGYWRGVHLRDGSRPSEFDYFQLKDAGQNCPQLFCPDAAFLAGEVTFSFTNSSVSNSYVLGMSLGDVTLSAFHNNRFYGNVDCGLDLPLEPVDMLDAESDYAGEEAPNGEPFVCISSEQDSAGVYRWRALNAPYLIDAPTTIAGGRVVIEPGVQVVFDAEAWLEVQGNGELQAVGTPEAPIRFVGREAVPGYWDGIRFDGSTAEQNELSYVEIRHTGYESATSTSSAALSLDESTLRISNTVIADNGQDAVDCREPNTFFDASTLYWGANVLLQNNASNEVGAACEVYAAD